MSNIFKTNSRFAALAEDVPFTKKNKKNLAPENPKIEENNSFKNDGGNSFKNDGGNSFKNEGNSFKNEGNSFKNNYEKPQSNYEDRGGVNCYTNRYSKENQEKRAQEEKLREEEKKRIKEENLTKSMAPENFPTLISTPLKEKNIPQKKNISFVEKLSTKNSKKVEEIEDFDFKHLKPGWCIIKKDPNTGKTIFKTKGTFIEEKSIEDNSHIEVLNALVALHEKRTAEYIELYGYDTWEKMFRSPTWDYEYFDRLDQEYEEEMERLQEEEDAKEKEDFSTDYDKHNNYWKH
jgi:hypothetical protein